MAKEVLKDSTTWGTAKDSINNMTEELYNMLPSAYKSSLYHAQESTIIQILGDSTSNDTTDWAYVLGQKLATKYALTHNVKYKLYNNITGIYGATVDLNIAGEDRHLIVNTGQYCNYLPVSEIALTSADLDIAIKVAPDSWTISDYYVYVCKINTPGGYGWGVIQRSGKIQLQWSEDGTTLKYFDTTIATSGFADGEVKWIRITLDVDDGAGNSIATAYTSTNGVDWTLVKETITAATTTIYTSDAIPYRIGGRNSGAGIIPGKYYEVILRDGIGGANIMPQNIESWKRDTVGSAWPTIGGTPTIYIYNASVAGFSTASFTADVVKKSVPKTYGAITLWNIGHNDIECRDSVHVTTLDSFWALVKANAIMCQPVLITQNPIVSPAAYLQGRPIRKKMLMSYAKTHSMEIVDTYDKFLRDSRGLAALLNADGLHPNTTGSELAADTIFKQLFV